MKINPAKRTETVQEYYFSRKLKEIAEIKSRGINIINLGIGSPDTPPSASTIDKLIESSKNPKNHGYQSYNGIPELRNALAVWYKKYYNLELNPKNEILPLMGSKEGIMHISMAFINEGDEVLVPNPGYPTYQSVSNLVGAKIIYYNLKEENNWLPDINELEKENLDNVKLMWVNYPNMPTGAGSTKELFQNLVDFGLRNNILICNDNPYSFILNDRQQSILEAKGAKEIALELNSLSKSHSMAGWRIGMVAGNEEYINTILKVKSNMDSGMFLPLQQAAVEALKNSEQWFNNVNEIYGERRQIVFEILDLLNCKYNRDQTGLFVWAKISDEFENGEKFSNYILKRANVFITPGSVFGSNGDSYIRISLCTEKIALFEVKSRIATLIQNNL